MHVLQIVNDNNLPRESDSQNPANPLRPTMMMRRFDSKIYPAIHTASDEIIREQKLKIEELKKRENIAKAQIKKLEREVGRSQKQMA